MNSRHLPARNRALSISLCVVCAAAAWLPTAARAQCGPGETAVAADRDNTLYEDDSGAFSNGAGNWFFAGTTNGFSVRRGLVRFDVAGALGPGSTVTSAALRLNMSRTISGASNVRLHLVLQDWGEGTSDAVGEEGIGAPPTVSDATWIHTFFATDFWTTPGGDFSATASATALVSGLGLYIWGSTAAMVADVQGWVDNPAANFGWLLIGEEGFPATAKRFDSRDNPFGVPPVLCVATDLVAPGMVEVPSLGVLGLVALALTLAGLGVFGLRRR